jgi:hypothetical protein
VSLYHPPTHPATRPTTITNSLDRYTDHNQSPCLTFETELTGRFLHITDFHPDPWYRTNSTFDSGCHRLPPKKKKGKKGKGGDKNKDLDGDDDDDDEVLKVAGKWGTSVS